MARSRPRSTRATALRKHVEPGAGADALARQNTPIGPRPGPAGEQAMEMPREVMQALAALKPARDHRHEGFDRLESVGDRRLVAEQLRVDADQEFGRLIGGAPDHDPVDMPKLGAR